MSASSPNKRVASSEKQPEGSGKRSKDEDYPSPDISPVENDPNNRPWENRHNEPVIRTDASIADFKAAIADWNFQASFRDQTDTAVTCAYGYMFTSEPRPDSTTRDNFLLSHILFFRLLQTLCFFGCANFSLSLIADDMVLYVAAASEDTIVTLPSWLQIPFVKLVPDLNLTYTPEGTAPTSDRIRLGDTITDQRGVESDFGTLGVIMIDPTEFGDQPYGITAGHVLAGGDDFFVTNRVTREQIEGSRVALKNPDRNDPLSAEVGIMKLDMKDADKMCSVMHRTTMHHYQTFIDTDNLDEPLFNFNNTRYKAITDAIHRERSIFVHKDGASTGLTMGRLTKLEWTLPWDKKSRTIKDYDMELCFDDDFAQTLLEEYKDLIQPKTHRWVGIVSWLGGYEFVVGGDSGALVYSMDKSIKIPLGIHLGKPQGKHYKQSSAFLSLDSYMIEAHLLGLQLEFEDEKDE